MRGVTIMRFHDNEATNSEESIGDAHTQTDAFESPPINMVEHLEQIPEQTVEEIRENLRVKNYVFQFIDHQTGQRSEPFLGRYDTLREIIETAKERNQKPADEDYILLVAVIGDNDEDTIIPGTPLISVKSFMDLGA